MNNRANFKDVQDFLKFKKEQKCTKQTINVYDVLLRHAIRWCDEIAFTECFKNKISLPTYCENLVSNGEISDETARRICTTFSEFLSYEALENKQRYKNIKPSFIAGFRYKTYTDNAKIPAYFTLDEMKKIASIQTDDLSMKRSKAAACFMYLSGMRLRAFLSLTIECVNLDKMQVMQFPEKGTYTKFKKRAITSLYNIPELLQVVKEWDNSVRSVSAPWSTWYPRYDSTGKSFKNYAPETKDRDKAFQNIGSMTRQFYKDQKKLCILADVDYKGAHAFRHGHAHFGLINAKTPQDMKAVSQNLMHKSTAITDEIYSRMTAADTNKIITQLGTNISQNVNS